MFNHIVSGETGYLRLLTGQVPEDRVRESTPRPLSELREPIRWLAERWIPALEAERDPEAVLPYQRGDDAEHMADWVPLVQCAHHGDDQPNSGRHAARPPRHRGAEPRRVGLRRHAIF